MSVQLPPNASGTIVETFNPVANTYNGGGNSTAERQVVSIADGGKATYSASYLAQSVGTSATTAIFYLAGSASKVVRLLQVIVNVTVLTAGQTFDLLLQKETILPTGGTKATAATIVPWDSADGAATATTAFYTAAPTDGTITGVIFNGKLSAYLAVATTALPPIGGVNLVFGLLPGAKAPVLRGAAQGIVATLNGGTPGYATSFDVTLVWTEE
jgi:hypothetical protein